MTRALFAKRCRCCHQRFYTNTDRKNYCNKACQQKHKNARRYASEKRKEWENKVLDMVKTKHVSPVVRSAVDSAAHRILQDREQR